MICSQLEKNKTRDVKLASGIREYNLRPVKLYEHKHVCYSVFSVLSSPLFIVSSHLSLVPLCWDRNTHTFTFMLSVSQPVPHLSVCPLLSNSYHQKCCPIYTLLDITPPPPPSLGLFFWEEAKWCSQRIPLVNNYPFRWNCKTIYGVPHLFQPASKTLIASKISICGSAESEFIVRVGLECDSTLFVPPWMWLVFAFVCLCVLIHMENGHFSNPFA